MATKTKDESQTRYLCPDCFNEVLGATGAIAVTEHVEGGACPENATGAIAGATRPASRMREARERAAAKRARQLPTPELIGIEYEASAEF